MKRSFIALIFHHDSSAGSAFASITFCVNKPVQPRRFA